jgi:hypothetical protein
LNRTTRPGDCHSVASPWGRCPGRESFEAQRQLCYGAFLDHLLRQEPASWQHRWNRQIHDCIPAAGKVRPTLAGTDNRFRATVPKAIFCRRLKKHPLHWPAGLAAPDSRKSGIGVFRCAVGTAGYDHPEKADKLPNHGQPARIDVNRLRQH